jgi:hypothetical protein
MTPQQRTFFAFCIECHRPFQNLDAWDSHMRFHREHDVQRVVFLEALAHNPVAVADRRPRWKRWMARWWR